MNSAVVDPDAFRLPNSMLGVLRRGAVDFTFFTRFWLGGWEPHPGQLEWATTRAKNKGLTTGSRWGKSEIEAALGLWDGFYGRNLRGLPTLNCSITLDQARIVIDKAEMLARRGRLWSMVEDVVASPFPMLRLRNGWEYWARSTQLQCKYIRGHAFWKINYDEASWGSQRDLAVLLLRLADVGGWFSYTTTPRGQGWIYRRNQMLKLKMAEQLAAGVAHEQLTHYFRTGPSWENPHNSREYLEEQAANLTDAQYRAEVLGEDVPNEDTVFAIQYLERVFNADLHLPRAEGGSGVCNAHSKAGDKDCHPEEGGLYVAGWDLGRKSSWTVGTFLRWTGHSWRAEHRIRLFQSPWPETIAVIDRESARWRTQADQTAIDSTGLGDVVVGMLQNTMPEAVLFSPLNRTNLITGLQKAVQTPGALEVPFWPELYDDMVYFSWSGQSENDEEKRTWDDVFSLALAWHKAQQVRTGPLEIDLTGEQRVVASIEKFEKGQDDRGRRDRFFGR